MSPASAFRSPSLRDLLPRLRLPSSPPAPCMSLNRLSSSCMCWTASTCLSTLRAARAVFAQSLPDTARLRATEVRAPDDVALTSVLSTSPPASVMPNVKTQMAAAPRGSRATAASFCPAALLGT